MKNKLQLFRLLELMEAYMKWKESSEHEDDFIRLFNDYVDLYIKG